VDAFLPGDHHHGHRAEQGVGRPRGQVQCPRAEGGDAHPGLAGEPADGRGHEGGRLLVPGEDQLDARLAQRLEDVQVLLARYPENALHPFVLKRADQQVGGFGHAGFPSVWAHRRLGSM
jgi:hypothetical protein